MNAMPARPLAWAFTTGEAGMRTQARGLAQAVASTVVEKIAAPASPLDWLDTFIGGARLAGAFPPPWPDLLITCGRRSAPYAAALKRASGGAILTVHIQDPRAFRSAFDLIIAMDHDSLVERPGVIKVPTALHDLTQPSLDEAGAAWKDRFTALGHPVAGVSIGGDLRGRPFSLADASRLIAGLRRLRQEGNVALAITPSRRTPQAVRELLQETFGADPGVFIWDRTGANPYRAILALSDRLVVTTDSVSMVSEAIASGRPTELFDLDFPRHRGFVQKLIDQGAARRFTGDPTPPAPGIPLDSTAIAARAVRRLLQERTGVCG